MTHYILYLLLLVILELLTVVGVCKILSCICDEAETDALITTKRKGGTDFWQNIISYDHKKKGGDKD